MPGRVRAAAAIAAAIAAAAAAAAAAVAATAGAAATTAAATAATATATAPPPPLAHAFQPAIVNLDESSTARSPFWETSLAVAVPAAAEQVLEERALGAAVEGHRELASAGCRAGR